MDFKQVAILSIVLIAYLCAGAAMFREMEGRTEKDVIQKLDRMFDHFLGKFYNKVSSKQELQQPGLKVWNSKCSK